MNSNQNVNWIRVGGRAINLSNFTSCHFFEKVISPVGKATDARIDFFIGNEIIERFTGVDAETVWGIVTEIQWRSGQVK